MLLYKYEMIYNDYTKVQYICLRTFVALVKQGKETVDVSTNRNKLIVKKLKNEIKNSKHNNLDSDVNNFKN